MASESGCKESPEFVIEHAVPVRIVRLGLLKTEGNLMKKLLLASTALVATAGIAAADVNVQRLAHVLVLRTMKELARRLLIQPLWNSLWLPRKWTLCQQL